jgi:hypothetical protein
MILLLANSSGKYNLNRDLILKDCFKDFLNHLLIFDIVSFELAKIILCVSLRNLIVILND